MFSELEHLLYISLQVTLGSSYIQACKSIWFFMYLVYIYIYIYGFFPLDRNSNHRLPSLEIQSRHYIDMYAFSRCFYPKWPKSGYPFFVSMCVPWELNPQPFALLTQCSTTEPQEHITTLIPPLYKSRSAFPSVNRAPGGCPSAEMFTSVESAFPPRGPPFHHWALRIVLSPPHPPYGAPDNIYTYIYIYTELKSVFVLLFSWWNWLQMTEITVIWAI